MMRLLVPILSFSVLSACAGQVAPSALVVGQAAPQLSGVDVEGRPVDLAALAGKVVVVDFWASWCEPCEQAMPELDALSAAHADRLVVIGVSVDEDPAAMQAFVDRVNVGFTLIHDADHEIANHWAPPKMPSSFVIAPDGAIAAIHGGYDTSTGKALRADVDALLAK
jgi:cytochrome c biogenesis protein CcmG/thiol:disulfide interchange protein DsbE